MIFGKGYNKILKERGGGGYRGLARPLGESTFGAPSQKKKGNRGVKEIHLGEKKGEKNSYFALRAMKFGLKEASLCVL